ncbi:MAG: glycine cleavage system protein GcvH [Verrucomicrobiota bacterium]
MNVPTHLKYAESHEWLEEGADGARVGISDHAQSELSDVVYVELPAVGRKVAAKESVAIVESVKAASDIYSPVGGEITEVNSKVEQDPSLINSDPYGEGWLFKIKVDEGADLGGLFDGAGYEGLIG